MPWSDLARREFALLLLLGGSRKGAVQLWLRKQRIIYANAQQAAGRPATKAKRLARSRRARQAGGKSKPETGAAGLAPVFAILVTMLGGT